MECGIDKDVVYKLAGVLADLGAAKGVIAALSGWTVQAAQVAAQANIELWGPDELTARLGQVTVSGVRLSRTQVRALGVRFASEGDPAHRLVERMAHGTLGIDREEIVWLGPIWLPGMDSATRHHPNRGLQAGVQGDAELEPLRSIDWSSPRIEPTSLHNSCRSTWGV